MAVSDGAIISADTLSTFAGILSIPVALDAFNGTIALLTG